MSTALNKHLAGLTPEQLRLLDSYVGMDIETYTAKVKELFQKHQVKSRSLKIVQFFETIFTSLRMYTPYMVNAVQGGSNPAAPVLASLMCVLQLSANFAQYHDKIAQTLVTMNEKASILVAYKEEIYESDEKIQSIIETIFGNIVDFSQHCLKLLVDKKGRLRTSAKLWCVATWRDFDASLGKYVEQFHTHLEYFHERALASDRQRVKTTDFAQSQFRDIQRQEMAAISYNVQGARHDVTQLLQNDDLRNQAEEKKKRDKKIKAMRLWLRPHTTEYLSHRYDNGNEHLEGTGMWYILHDRYTKWKAEEASALLWTTGKPGCGKSMLATLAIEDLQGLKDSDTAVAYVYCKTQGGSQLDSIEVLCTLLTQLFSQSNAIDWLYEKLAEDTDDYQSAPLRVVQSALEELVSKFARTFVIVDGLDECLDGAKIAELFLSFLNKTASVLKIGIFSRPHHLEINRALESHKPLQVDSGANEDDIRRYISERLSAKDLASEDSGTIYENVKGQLLSNADGMFLWVKLLVGSLRKQATPNQLLSAVRRIPRGLDATYEICLARIFESEDVYTRDCAFKILLWAVNARTPLSLEETIDAIAVDPQNQTFDAGDKFKTDLVLTSCADLIRLNNEGKIVPIHTSLRDYLLSEPSHRTQPFAHFRKFQDQAQQILGDVCLSYLSLEQFKCGPFSRLEGLLGLVEEFPFLAYASCHWADHVDSGEECSRNALVSKLANTRSNRELSMQSFLYYTDRGFSAEYSGSRTLHFLAMYGLQNEIIASQVALFNALARDCRGRIPVDYALSCKRRSTTLSLLQFSYQLVNRPWYGIVSAMHVAAINEWMEVLEWLLERGFDSEMKTKNGNTALMSAISEGARASVVRLLQAGVNVNCANNDGNSPLLMAVSNGQQETVSLLIDAGADVNLPKNNGESALLLATAGKQDGIVQLLLEHGANPDVVNWTDDGWTPLHYCARNDAFQNIKLLLRKGATIWNPCKNGQTPLHVAAAQNSLSAVRTLIEEGADPKTADQSGANPFHLAAKNGHHNVLEFLSTKDSEAAHVIDNLGNSSLDYAVSNGHEQAVRSLLAMGINANWKRGGEAPPLSIALLEDHLDIANVLLEHGADPMLNGYLNSPALHYAALRGQQTIIKSLRLAGADVHAQNDNGTTALHLACEEGHTDFVSSMLESHQPLDVNVKDKFGSTPLLLAAKTGRTRVVSTLLATGAVSLPDQDLNHPIHLATYGGYEDIVAALITYSPEVIDVRGYFGRTPLAIAAMKGELSIARLLFQAGADFNSKDNFGNTPASTALSMSHVDLFNWLREIGADLFSSNKFGTTLAHEAAKIGNTEVLRGLLDAGFNGLETDVFRTTPLCFAVIRNKLETARAIIERRSTSERGCDATKILTTNGLSCVLVAAQYGDLDMLKSIVSAGGDPLYKREGYGQTAFHFAAATGNIEVIPYLLELGVEPNCPSQTNYSPLGEAAQGAYPEFVRELIKIVVEVDLADNVEGMTPLLLAAAVRAPKVCAQLILAGANPYYRDRRGRDAFSHACGHLPTINALKQVGEWYPKLGIVSQRRDYAMPHLESLINSLLSQQNHSSLRGKVVRRHYVRALGQCLAFVHDSALDDHAALCFAELNFVDELSPFANFYDCSLCGNRLSNLLMQCKYCYETRLCGTCFQAYVEGGHMPRSPPLVYLSLEQLEKQAEDFLHTLVRLVKPLSSTFDIMRFWLSFANMFERVNALCQEYESWEDKFEKSVRFSRGNRPGQRLLKLGQLMRGAMEDLFTEISESSEMDSMAYIMDFWQRVTTGKLQSIFRNGMVDVEAILRERKTKKEFREFACYGHNYVEVSEAKWNEAKENGDVELDSGMLNQAWLKRLLAEAIVVKANLAQSEDNPGDQTVNATLDHDQLYLVNIQPDVD